MYPAVTKNVVLFVDDSQNRYTITENMNIQHYKPGGGFKKWHFENTGPKSMSRKLVFMTYLNDVDDGGTTDFDYYNIKVFRKMTEGS